jgi:hypothetical protein
MEAARPIAAPEVPPGAPIGSEEEGWCGMADNRRNAFFPPIVR